MDNDELPTAMEKLPPVGLPHAESEYQAVVPADDDEAVTLKAEPVTLVGLPDESCACSLISPAAPGQVLATSTLGGVTNTSRAGEPATTDSVWLPGPVRVPLLVIPMTGLPTAVSL